MNQNEKRHEYPIEVRAFSNPTALVATSPEIRGLVLEVETVGELYAELLAVTSHLLKANHGLTDNQIAQTQLNVTLMGSEAAPNVPSRPRVVIEDRRTDLAIA